MSPKAAAKRIADRSWKIKDRIISLKDFAQDANLPESLVDELYDGMIAMDEIIATAERLANQPSTKATQ